MATRFRGEDFLEINQSAIRIAYGGHVCFLNNSSTLKRLTK
jgi:hypothetical protein